MLDELHYSTLALYTLVSMPLAPLPAFIGSLALAHRHSAAGQARETLAHVISTLGLLGCSACLLRALGWWLDPDSRQFLVPLTHLSRMAFYGAALLVLLLEARRPFWKTLATVLLCSLFLLGEYQLKRVSNEWVVRQVDGQLVSDSTGQAYCEFQGSLNWVQDSAYLEWSLESTDGAAPEFLLSTDADAFLPALPCSQSTRNENCRVIFREPGGTATPFTPPQWRVAAPRLRPDSPPLDGCRVVIRSLAWVSWSKFFPRITFPAGIYLI